MDYRRMQYTMVATLGPASAGPDIWAPMLAAGVNGFRLNTSHLSLPQLQDWLARLERFFSLQGQTVPVVLDLQGSKWRLGRLPTQQLQAGQPVHLALGDASPDPYSLPVPHPDFFAAAAQAPGEVVLNDARVRLMIEKSGPDWVQARVIQAGEVASAKGITLTDSPFRQEALGAKDGMIFEAARQQEYVRFAISYVRDAVEMQRYRALFGAQTYLIAKLERQPAVSQAAEIAAFSDELWLCRGDLGAELGLDGMAQAVHEFASVPSRLDQPVLMAGQVLEHMSAHPSPTRSEMCYLYDTLQLGYAGLVLSDETAIGRFPLESCRNAALFKPAQATR